MFIIGFLILLILFLIYYIISSKPIPIVEKPTITIKPQQIRELEYKVEELDSNQTFKLAETHHYGRFNTPIDLNKAIQYYRESIQKTKDVNMKGKCFMALGRLFSEGSKSQPPDAVSSIDCYLNALNYGYEEAILSIAKIYMDGLHPYYLPEKLTAAKLYNLIVYETRFSDGIKNIAKQASKEAYKIAYADLDRIPEGDRTYKPLPYGIYQDVSNILQNHQGMFIEYDNAKQYIAETAPRYEPEEDIITQLHHVPDQLEQDIIFNDIMTQQNIITHERNQNILDLVPEQRIYNDSQNVHSSTVNNTALQKLEMIEDTTPICKDFKKNTNEFLSSLNGLDLSQDDKDKAIQLLNSLKELKHSKFNKSETDIFNTVWSRIKDPINKDRQKDMIQVLAQNLASGIEHNYTVCSTGRLTRIIGSLDAMDAGDLPNLKPEWAINQEVAQTAAKVREDLLNSVDEAEKRQYESGESKLSEVMKNTFKEKCKKDYVDANILTQDKLDTLLVDYIDNF